MSYSALQRLSGKVARRVGNESVEIELSVDSAQCWQFNGTECPAVNGYIDLDPDFSPSTNLLPIRQWDLTAAPVWCTGNVDRGRAGEFFKLHCAGVRGWIGVKLDCVSYEELEFHLCEAWRQVAPKLQAALRPVRGQIKQAELLYSRL